MWIEECQKDQDHDDQWDEQEIACWNLWKRAVNKIRLSHSGIRKEGSYSKEVTSWTLCAM